MKMKMIPHTGFIDVVCNSYGMNELEIEARLRDHFANHGILVSSDPPGRVGSDEGTIFRFNVLKEEI